MIRRRIERWRLRRTLTRLERTQAGKPPYMVPWRVRRALCWLLGHHNLEPLADDAPTICVRCERVEYREKQ